MKSPMHHNFSRVPTISKPRSSMQRNSFHKTTFDADYLYPIFLDEVLPGDTHTVKTDGFCRMSTLLYPLMDNVFLETFFFFVPTRLVWANFVKMMGEQDNPGDSTDYTVPSFANTSGAAQEEIWDYFGIPTKEQDVAFSKLPGRCYNLIWNTWFRDQNLQDSVTFTNEDTGDAISEYELLKRGKRHDYFTSCLPWPAKFFEGQEISLPIGETAPVLGIGVDDSATAFSSDTFRDTEDDTHTWTYNKALYAEVDQSAAGGQPGPIYADLTGATGAALNAFRLAVQTQRLYEHDARSGTRYIEKVYAEFGVRSSDARLQRPEFLGGGSSRLKVTPIPYNAEGATAAVGTLAAMGTVGFQNHGFTKSFEEHGYIIGLANIRADLSYQNGLHKLWSRSDRLDFYTPTLAHIGEQAVLNKELFAQGTSADDDVFGYQEAWAEYRYKNSILTGLFRSNATGSLDPWHLAQEFGSLPTLGDSFIQSNTPTDRVVAVTSEPAFIGEFFFEQRSARVMPMYSIPGMMDHF
jgi:hypothetical protein